MVVLDVLVVLGALVLLVLGAVVLELELVEDVVGSASESGDSAIPPQAAKANAISKANNRYPSRIMLVGR